MKNLAYFQIIHGYSLPFYEFFYAALRVFVYHLDEVYAFGQVCDIVSSIFLEVSYQSTIGGEYHYAFHIILMYSR